MDKDLKRKKETMELLEIIRFNYDGIQYFGTYTNSFQFVDTGITYGFSLSPPLELSYKLSDFDASMFPPISGWAG